MNPKDQLTQTGRLSLRPYTAKQLYEMYGVSDKTFRKWLEPFSETIGEKKGRYYTIGQVKAILECLGTPSDIVIE